MKTLLLTEPQLRQAAGFHRAEMEAVAHAFVEISRESLVMPKVQRMDFPEVEGEIDIKSAAYDGVDGFVVKMSTGFFQNPTLGLPSGSGLMVLFDRQTGFPKAILLDNGYLTNIRTGLAGAVAARCLGFENQAPRVLIIGAGQQARMQAMAMNLVLSPKAQTTFFGRNANRVREVVNGLAPQLNYAVTSGTDLKSCVEEADLIITTTPAGQPLFPENWLRQDASLICMGSDSPMKNEIDPKLLLRASQVVCDSRQQCLQMGEIHHAVQAGLNPDAVLQLGDIISCSAKLRSGLRICDLTGTGAQDNAIANFAFSHALEKGWGHEFSN